MRLVLAKGRSQYGSLRLHIDQLAAALLALGHEVDVFDLVEADGLGATAQAIVAGADGFFTFNGVACEIAALEPVRVSGCVYASLYVDHPVHHLPRLEQPIDKQALFFLDRSHVQFVKAWGAARGHAHVGFLPPGANQLAAPVDVSDEAFTRRDIPLLFTGTYRGLPTPAWSDWPESPAKDLVVDTAGRMTADGRVALLDALNAALAARKTPLTPALLHDLAPLLSGAQLHAEAWHRHAVLTALGEAGVPMEVYGNGWEPIRARYPSFRHAGEGSFEETLRLLRRTRIVLNINNGFVAGGHERVFTAMAAGAAVFSESSRYYDEAFQDDEAGPGREIATYPVNKPALAAAELAALLPDLPAQAAMARAGCARTLADHTWAARAGKIVKAIEAARS